MFVNNSGDATLFPISNSSESIGTVIFVRSIEIFSLVAGIASVAYLIYAAIQFSLAAGDEAKIEQAKKALIWSMVGIVVFMMTYLLINATQQAAHGVL